MVNCPPLRRVELFFIKFFTFCIKLYIWALQFKRCRKPACF
ncbi:hypothetical protein HMPREF9554_02763 [Treponema phagedenis F0421]|nr:hypothetical protein HMPREF9554_02763 [Treponema phagedenis F0421]